MKRVLDILYKSKNQHIGSCLTVTPILEEIYNTKKENDIVVLSALANPISFLNTIHNL